MAGDRSILCTVGELAAPIKNALVGGPFGSDLGSADYVPSGVPVIRGQNLSNGKFVGGDCVYVSESKADKLKSNLARPGDLVFTQRGNAVLHGGQVAIVPDGKFDRYVVSQSQMKLTPDSSKVDSRFLYFVFSSSDYSHYLRSNAIVTGVPHINLSLLRDYQLYLPPLAEQRAIAAVLGALDDKIELNRRMNATLEAMARALFQSWFVDFDPVRAKLDGREPAGMDAETAALFPDGFKESELGHIPTGWHAIPLYDTAQWVNGAAFRSEDFCATGEGLPVIKIAELKDGISTQTKWCQRDAAPEKIIDTGDLLYSWSGSPDTSLEAFLWSSGRGLLNQHIFKVISPTAAEKRFVYYLLQHLRPLLVETARNKQTTGLGHVTIVDMKRLLVCMPNKGVLSAFDRNIATIFDRAFTNTLESRTLATLRDTLLPKLLSGELSVADVEHTMENA